jgi:uncharacterized membrane protein
MCKAIRRQVIELKEAQLTWSIIGVSVAIFLILFILLLYCIHRRNVRQMNRKSNVNNQNVKPKIKVPPKIEIAEESFNSEKLLVKKSDV